MLFSLIILIIRQKFFTESELLIGYQVSYAGVVNTQSSISAIGFAFSTIV
jgi:hypothetical protein